MTPEDVIHASKLIEKLRGQKNVLAALSTVSSTRGFENIVFGFTDTNQAMGEDAHHPLASQAFTHLCHQGGLEKKQVIARMTAAFRDAVAEQIAAAEADLASLGVTLEAK